jgi:hypothetical protein
MEAEIQGSSPSNSIDHIDTDNLESDSDEEEHVAGISHINEISYADGISHADIIPHANGMSHMQDHMPTYDSCNSEISTSSRRSQRIALGT